LLQSSDLDGAAALNFHSPVGFLPEKRKGMPAATSESLAVPAFIRVADFSQNQGCCKDFVEKSDSCGQAFSKRKN
jgi:hypothetical protein